MVFECAPNAFDLFLWWRNVDVFALPSSKGPAQRPSIEVTQMYFQLALLLHRQICCSVLAPDLLESQKTLCVIFEVQSSQFKPRLLEGIY